MAQETDQEQQTSVLIFDGSPVRVPFACTEKNIQSLNVTCTETEPCAVFLELSGVDAVGNHLFVFGNLHSGASTFSSVLLISDDRGKSWKEAHPGIPNGVLEDFQFVDLSHGWIAGQILTQLPRDPFFLITQDGGSTWKKRDLFDEGKSGFIETFFFDSKMNGMLTLDRSRGVESGSRYEQYETQTGGSTWALREVSPTPIPLKKKKAPLTELRLRADAGSGTYRIEQLVSGKWTLLSSFLIELPTCLVKFELAEPPAEPEPEAAQKEIVIPRSVPSLKKKK